MLVSIVVKIEDFAKIKLIKQSF